MIIDTLPSQVHNDLRTLFSPRGIVVVGASTTPGKLGTIMAGALANYDAPIALVNPKGAGIYRTVSEAAKAADSPLDLAVLCVPAAATAAVLREAAEAGVSHALVCAGGFGEAGEIGQEYQQEVEAAVAETGIRLLGPNTSGFFAPAKRLCASFVPGVGGIGAGPVGVISSSGGVNHAISFRLQNAGSGVSLGVGLGSGIDIEAADVVDYLTDDEDTSVIALHIETIANGPRLAKAIRRATAEKPVVALVVGQNDVDEFAQSHTGALATSWRTSRSVLQQAGAVCVEDETELVDVAVTLSQRRIRPHPNPGVAIITGQAGPGLLIADHLAGTGINIPTLDAATTDQLSELLPPLTYQKNPIDTGRPGPEFPDVVRTVANDEAIQAMALYGILEPVIDLPEAVGPGTQLKIPAVIGVDGLHSQVIETVDRGRSNQLPVLSGPTAVARGIVGLVRDAQTQYTLTRPAIAADPLVLGDGPWDEAQAKSILTNSGIPVPRSVRVASHQEALDCMTEMNKPVALKLLDAAVLHKTEVGGVHLNIETPEQLVTALQSLDAIGASEYLLEEMAPDGIDLVAGARQDPVFGPVVLVGIGGTATEALDDVAVRGVPLRDGIVEEMVDELQAGALLHGWRGGPQVNMTELAAVLSVLLETIKVSPQISEIEINPLRLTDNGLIALDALFVSQSFSDEERE